MTMKAVSSQQHWLCHPLQSLDNAPCLTLPADKSLSHRALMFAALSEGESVIRNCAFNEDVRATEQALAQLGVNIQRDEANCVWVEGVGLKGLRPSDQALDLRNSGTSMRLLSGILVGQDFASTLIGDDSLMCRPMLRIVKPLQMMNARIRAQESGCAPLCIQPSTLTPLLDYRLPVASAQVKSALLLAGLFAKGKTTILSHHQQDVSRDHTEHLLRYLGADVQVVQEDDATRISITGQPILQAKNMRIAGDPSAAAFWTVGALLAKEGRVWLKDVHLNPCRLAFVDVLRRMGANITLKEHTQEASIEPFGDICVSALDELQATSIHAQEAAKAIDELPILMIAMAYAKGVSTIAGVGELRVKESDRLLAMINGLNRLGICTHLQGEVLHIEGGHMLGGEVESFADHRIAMSFAIAAIGAQSPILVKDCACVRISDPIFLHTAQAFGLRIEHSEE